MTNIAVEFCHQSKINLHVIDERMFVDGAITLNTILGKMTRDTPIVLFLFFMKSHTVLANARANHMIFHHIF